MLMSCHKRVMAVGRRRLLARFYRSLSFTLKFGRSSKRTASFICIIAVVVVLQVVFVSRILVKRNSRLSNHLPSDKVSTQFAPVPSLGVVRKNNTVQHAESSVWPTTASTATAVETYSGKFNVTNLPRKQNITTRITKELNNTTTVKPTLDYRILHEYYPPVNFSIIEPYVTPEIEDKNIFLLVIISSGTLRKPNAERRQTIRKTWANKKMFNVASYGVAVNSGSPFRAVLIRSFKVVFLMGKSGDQDLDAEIEAEARKYNDIVIGNFDDIYNNLILKVFMGFKWAADFNCKYILKGDDDTYISIPRLLTVMQGVPRRFFGGYVVIDGHVFRDVRDRHAISKKYWSHPHYPPYCEGAFYVFSFNLLPEFLKLTEKFRPFHVEDAYLGILLQDMEIHPLFMPGFSISNWMTSNLYNFHPCEWATAIAIGHKFNSSHIQYAHSKFTMVDPSKLTDKEWQVCNRKPLTSNTLLPALYGMLISLALILIYITVAFLPSRDEYEENLHSRYQRRNYYPYVYRAGQ